MHTHCGQFICQAVICFPLNGPEVMMKMIKINHLSRLCYSVTRLIRALSSFILLLPPPHFAPFCPSPVPCLHLLYCFLSSHPPSFHHPHALRPPSLSSSFPPSSLQIFNPHSSPLPTTPRSLLSNQIHNGAHSLKIFPLHSNAPPHHCNSAATDAGRRCDANYIRGDYILPRLIFPAVARRDSLSFTACSYFIPVFLFFLLLSRLFFPLFLLSFPLIHTFLCTLRYLCRKIIISTGYQGACKWSHVGPLSVISHNKVNKLGCCVGCS